MPLANRVSYFLATGQAQGETQFNTRTGFSKSVDPTMHEVHSENDAVDPHRAVVFPRVVPYAPSPACGPGNAK